LFYFYCYFRIFIEFKFSLIKIESFLPLKSVALVAVP